MKDFEQNIQKVAERITLSPEDKALMRERLVSYMEHKPIRNKSSTPSPVRIPTFIFFKRHHFSGALAVALMATVSTFGVTSAAGDALPGDLLYTVKVNVNEEIKTVLLSSDEDILEWEKERAEMRLMEASQLASEGRLDADNQEQVAKLLAEHTEAVAEKIHAVEESDPLLAAEVSTDFEVSLGAHEAVLARLIVEQEEGTADEGARDLVEQVRTAAKEAGELREGAEQIIVAQEEAAEVATVASDVADAPVVATQVEVDVASKKDSANLRERAAYRAVASAAQEAEKARVAVAKLDPASELAVQATEQMTSGEQLLAQGTQFLAENELGKAYGVSRRASATFRKVSLLLEAVDLFSIDILHETVVEELPKDVLTGNDFSVDASTTDEVIVKDEDALDVDYTKLRVEIEDKLAQARSMLLTLDGYDEETVTRANTLMKDAMAHVMRGEISLVLGDEDDAKKFFDTGFTQAERTLELLLRGAVAQELPETVVETPAEEPVTTPEVFGEISIKHRFEKGAHVWSGSFETPTPCSKLETGALVAESYPEQITLELNTMEPAGTVCAQVLTPHDFEIRAAASQEAVVRAVLVNGLPYKLIVTEE